MSKMELFAPTAANRGSGFFIPGKDGGASRDRTDDLKLAKLALSQLSYGPILSGLLMVGREGVEPSTSRLSGVRSNHLSYRPPCLAGREAAGGVSQLRLHSSPTNFLAAGAFPG